MLRVVSFAGSEMLQVYMFALLPKLTCGIVAIKKQL